MYYVLCLVLICFEFALCFSLGRKPQQSTRSLLFHLSYQPNPNDPDPANQDVVLLDVLWTNIQTCHGLGPASVLVDTQRCLWKLDTCESKIKIDSIFHKIQGNLFFSLGSSCIWFCTEGKMNDSSFTRPILLFPSSSQSQAANALLLDAPPPSCHPAALDGSYWDKRSTIWGSRASVPARSPLLRDEIITL